MAPGGLTLGPDHVLFRKLKGRFCLNIAGIGRVAAALDWLFCHSRLRPLWRVPRHFDHLLTRPVYFSARQRPALAVDQRLWDVGQSCVRLLLGHRALPTSGRSRYQSVHQLPLWDDRLAAAGCYIHAQGIPNTTVHHDKSWMTCSLYSAVWPQF